MSYKIAWLCVGDTLTGSSRIMCYTTHEYLVSHSIMSKILLPINPPPSYFDYYPNLNPQGILNEDWDIVVFQKIRGNAVLEMINLCKKRNIKTAYCLDDWRIESAQLANMCDCVIVSSEYIKDNLFLNHPQVVIIRQGYENATNIIKTDYTFQNKMCYVYGGKYIPEALQPALKESGWDLVTIGRNKTDTHKWNIININNLIIDCDIGIVPADISTSEGRSKSINRILLFMSLGLPVIASAVPEYYNIIKSGINGFIAYSPEDWKKYLNLLRDPILSKKIGVQAQKDTKKYSVERACKEYNEVFYKLAKEKWRV